MKTIITPIILIMSTLMVHGQNLYIKTFGDSKNKAIIFLHGGPGYNCANFEITSAQKLAENGFFVIVYDRRGEGRSKDLNAQFTFKETFEDLNSIIEKYKLNNVHLIGHSFGGVLATLFAENDPQKVASITLVGAPISLQKTFKTIITKSKTIYEIKNDNVNLNYISMLENMDKNSLEFSSYCFGHAMQNGFYSTKNPTEEAKNIFIQFRTDTTLIKYASSMSYEAPQGFWKNENYTSIDLTNNLIALHKNGLKIFGLYGKEDGLYSEEQVADLQNLIGKNNLKYFDNCSHNVFVDQQLQFIESLKKWLK